MSREKQDEVPFFGRWSRLKRQHNDRQSRDGEQPAQNSESDPVLQATQEVRPPRPVTEAVDPAPTAATVEDTEPANRPLTDADLPALDALDRDSDYSGFLSEGVSEALRRQALRKLFHQPQFNIRDGLNDYDEDFTHFTPLGDKLTYQLRRLMERQAAVADSAEPLSETQSSPSPEDDAQPLPSPQVSESTAIEPEEVEPKGHEPQATDLQATDHQGNRPSPQASTAGTSPRGGIDSGT